MSLHMYLYKYIKSAYSKYIQVSTAFNFIPYIFKHQLHNLRYTKKQPHIQVHVHCYADSQRDSQPDY